LGNAAFAGFIACVLVESAWVATWPLRRGRNLRKFYKRKGKEHPTCITTLNDEGYTSVEPGEMSCHYAWDGVRGFVENDSRF
jgi:hypothetical protein